MTAFRNPQSFRGPFRAGWVEVVESVTKKLAPFDGYELCLVGAETIGSDLDQNWRESIAGSPRILNTGYLAKNEELKDSSNAKVGHWTDVSSSRGTAQSLFEARRAFAELLEKPGNGGPVLIDVGCISKTLLASLVGMLLRTRAASSIDLLYRKRDYSYQGRPLGEVYAQGPLSHGINDIEFSFSAVPYVEGKYKSGKRRHCIVLCGLDFQRVLAKLGELEPAAIDIIIEREATLESESSAALKKACRYLGIPSDQVAEADRTQVAHVMELIGNAIKRSRGHDLHPLVLVAGGKPFAVAAALESVLRSEAPLLASVPDRVVNLESYPVGPYYVYRLKDLTTLV